MQATAGAGAGDEFQREKWARLHDGNAYFARSDAGPPDAYRMLRWRLRREGNAIAEINRTHMAGTEDLRSRAVLEIGFGGGWYLAQALRGGARKVYGLEAASNLIGSVSAAFDRLGLGPYDFRIVDERYLDALPRGGIDVMFSITVFQHISPDATASYLRTAPGALADGGFCLFQFLLNEDNPVRNPDVSGDEGHVSFTRAEVDDMVAASGLETVAYAETFRDAETGDYWAWYKIAKQGAGAPAAGGAAVAPHIRGLIPPRSRSVLFVGCGVGVDGESEDLLREVFGGGGRRAGARRGGRYRITGTDASAGRVRRREEVGPPGRYIAMDAGEGELGRWGQFDVVVCDETAGRAAGDGGLPRLLDDLKGARSRLLVIVVDDDAGTDDTRAGRAAAEFRRRGYYMRRVGGRLVAFKTADLVYAAHRPRFTWLGPLLRPAARLARWVGA